MLFATSNTQYLYISANQHDEIHRSMEQKQQHSAGGARFSNHRKKWEEVVTLWKANDGRMMLTKRKTGYDERLLRKKHQAESTREAVGSHGGTVDGPAPTLLM